MASYLQPIPFTKVSEFPFLREVDLEALAKLMKEGPDGKASPIVWPSGYEPTIKEVEATLFNAGTDNIWLSAPEGVGKSAVISGLLQKVAQHDAPPALLSKRPYIFNAQDFFRAPGKDSFETFDKAMQFLNENKGLLIIDRIDDLIKIAGADASYYIGGMADHANGNDVQIIMTSDSANEKLVEEKSSAIMPSFNKINMKEPDKNGLMKMLRAHRGYYESFHGVTIPEETIKEIVYLQARFPGRAFTQAWPQGPLNFLDRVCSETRIVSFGLPADIVVRQDEVWALKDEKASLLASSTGHGKKRITEIDARMKTLTAEIEPAKKTWEEKNKPYLDKLAQLANIQKQLGDIERRRGKLKENAQDLSDSDLKKRDMLMELERKAQSALVDAEKAMGKERPVAARAMAQKVFARVSGISVDTISTSEKDKLLNADKILDKRVLGQKAANEAVADMLRDARSGVADPNRPAGVILLVGPTGTGKTEEAKAVAELDGGEGSLPIMIKMNQFKDSSSVSSFIGAAPGLIMADKGAPHLEKVKKNPRGIPLFDEIEKAHPDIYDLIMQILDEGSIDTSMGESISFKDNFIIMTSNVILPEDLDGMDFNDQDALREALKNKINPKTGQPFFRPEFVERIDYVVMFNYLDAQAACGILRQQVDKQNIGLLAKNYRLEMDDDTAKALVEKYFNPAGGGRSVRQFYNKQIRSRISKHILGDNMPMGEEEEPRTIYVSFDGNEVKLTSMKPEQLKQDMRTAADALTGAAVSAPVPVTPSASVASPQAVLSPAL